MSGVIAKRKPSQRDGGNMIDFPTGNVFKQQHSLQISIVPLGRFFF
jgi:hypothetical protein